MSRIKNVFAVALGAILGSALTLLFVVMVGGGDISSLVPDFPHILSPDIKTLPYVDQLRIQRLLDKNVIFSADDLLGQIGTFYSTIIVFLIAIITVISLFTLFFVKVSAEEKAEAQAKSVARQAISDKIGPKIQQIDDHLNKFNESELNNRIQVLLKYLVLDSRDFWEKIDDSIYKKSEESLEDYNIESLARELNRNSEEIRSITSTIQQLNEAVDNLAGGNAEDEKVVTIGQEANNGNPD
ncbi:TPA: hypothetical protein ACOL2D_002352 [Vibrio parahaemolyticus]